MLFVIKVAKTQELKILLSLHVMFSCFPQYEKFLAQFAMSSLIKSKYGFPENNVESLTLILKAQVDLCHQINFYVSNKKNKYFDFIHLATLLVQNFLNMRPDITPSS